MKSIKKYLLLIAAALLTITLSACGTKITAEEAINKTNEASKNLKNTEFVSSNISEIVVGDQTQKIENKVSGSLILEPFTMHATTEIKAQDKTQTLEMYIKDNVAYAKATGQDTWVKSSNNNITAQFENLKKLANSEQVMEFYKKIAKDFKLTEENGNYVLTYSGNGDQFKELMVAIANSSGGQVNANAFNNVEFKNVNIKYVISKDFTPISNEVTMEVVSKIIPKAKTLKITQKITYSNVNKVNSIDLPEEVKNAKDKYDTKL